MKASGNEIRLRQSVQVSANGQARTFEIEVVLAADATAEEVEHALSRADVWMSGLTQRLDAHIAALAAPVAPEPATPLALAPPAANGSASLSMGEFLRAANELGFKSDELPEVLGVESVSTIDRAAALDRLRAMRREQTAPRGFAEEIDETARDDAEKEPDEPDFSPAPETEEDGAFAAEPAPVAQPANGQRWLAEVQRRLRDLRGLRSGNPPATPELRKQMASRVITPLGKERAEELIIAVWNPAQGEKLNAPRIRALLDWSKEDQFEELVEAVIAEARRAPVAGGE
jgi:hypothetical protein